MACGVSVAASTRVQIRVTASTAALTSSRPDSQRHNSPPGCSMIITPRKPTIASHWASSAVTAIALCPEPGSTQVAFVPTKSAAHACCKGVGITSSSPATRKPTRPG